MKIKSSITFNRTILELKLIHPSVSCLRWIAFNRTILELKSDTVAVTPLILYDFQSYHTGIEITLNLISRNLFWAFNRTILELKLNSSPHSSPFQSPFQSYHTGIEIFYINIEHFPFTPFNRTILELKWSGSTLIACENLTFNRTILELKFQIDESDLITPVSFQSYHTGIEIYINYVFFPIP